MSTRLFSDEMVEVLRWPAQTSPSEWADRFRVLGGGSAEPGPWRTSRVPYTREWMDSAACTWVRRVTIMKSTQIGGSESLLNVVGYCVDQDPGPLMFVMPSREEAEQYCDLRVMPMVRLSPALQRQIGEDRGDVKMRMLKFRRCVVLFRTARVASDLSQLAIQHLFGDEVDQWVDQVQGEGNPWKVALERTRTFKGRWRAWMTSTPTVHEGLVNTEFLAGDRRRFHMPCPHCAEWITFVWDQVKWPAEVTHHEVMNQRQEAWYECQRCARRIDDTQKHHMLQQGVWVPEGQSVVDWQARGAAQDRCTHRSYHLWAAYSPWLAWWEIVATYLNYKAQDGLREFHQKWLGLPWKETVRKTGADELEKCRRPYRRGQVAPDGVLWITAGVDTQGHGLPFTVRGWGLDGRSWLLDHGKAESFAALEAALFGRDWSGGDPRRAYLVVSLVVIDSRYREKECADLARKMGSHLVKLSKGSAFKGNQLFTVKKLDRHPITGEVLKDGLIELGSNTNLLKGRLSHAIAKASDGDEGALQIYEDIDPTYIGEMTAEELVVVRDSGGRAIGERWEKKEGRRANHFWDTEVLNFLAAAVLMIDQVRAQQLRERDRQAREASAPPGPPRRRRDDDDDDDGPRLWHRQ